MKQALALVAVLAVSSSVHADNKKYTLADLKALVSQRSFKEAVDHLQDVSPSERNGEWDGIAGDAAAGMIAGLSNDDLAAKVLTIEEVEKDTPVILKSAKYRSVREDVGMKAYTECFRADYLTEVCMQHALKFVDGDPGNTGLALKRGKLVRANAYHYVAVPYFKRAVANKANAPACKDEDLHLAVVAGIGLPKDDERAVDAIALASGPCWENVKKAVVDAFNAEESGYTVKNACTFLVSKGVLSPAQAGKCNKK
jgi:hypothetical protein